MKKLVLVLLFLVSGLFGDIGTIMALKGKASVERLSGVVEAKTGMILLEGDSITTKANSRVQVVLKDNTTISIGADSAFSFEEFSQDGKNSKLSMRAKRGFFRSVTGIIGKLAPDKFKVRTSTVTIGIRGSDFSGEIGSDRQVFKCFDGAIFIEFDGSINELEAGMMMEILGTKFEIQEIDSDKEEDSKVEKMKGIIIKSIDQGEIPTESIFDIIKIIEGLEEPPFDINLIPEDREIQY